MLPSWLNVENLQILALITMVVAAVGGIFMAIAIQKAATRAVMLLLALGLGVGSFVYRQNLDDCKPTCSCELGGMQVPDPNCDVVAAP